LVSVTDTLIIDLPLSVDPPEFSQIKVFPNPVKDKLIIKILNHPYISDYKIKIYNPTGLEVAEVLLNNPETELDIDLFGSAGIYILQVLDHDFQVVDTRKILIE